MMSEQPSRSDLFSHSVPDPRRINASQSGFAASFRSVPPTSRSPKVRNQWTSLPSTSIRKTRSTENLAIIQGEVKQVELLDEWNKAEYTSELLGKMKLAEFAYSSRNAQNDVDRVILQRRSKNAVSPVARSNESQVKHIQDLSYRRLLKKQNENLGREKSISARRYEDELERTVKELESQFQSLTGEAEQYREEASRYRSRIFQAGEDLKSAKKRLGQETPEKRRGSVLYRPEEIAKMISQKSQKQAILFQREQETREEVLIAKDQINHLRESALACDVRSSLVRKELEKVKRTQTFHFYRLLSEGKDSRGEGLAWIIKRLWKVGNTVTTDMFPEFLDEEAVHAVLFLAQKGLELEELTTYLAETRPSRGGSPQRPDRWNNIQSRLKSLTKTITMQQQRLELERNSKERGISLEDQPKSDILSQYADVTAVETRIRELKELVIKIQEAEVRRLTNECFLNNYEKRYKVTLKTLLSAIVGADVIDRYIATINKEQKTLSEQLAKTKTFTFAGRGS